MPRIVTVLSFLLLIHLPLCSQEIAEGDTCAMETPHQSRHQLKNKFLNRLYEKVKDFSRVDTNYIEPQKYNYTFMLQNTYTYEMYQLISKSGNVIVFSPEPSYKLGPYIGWRWIFLGYTIDLAHLSGDDNRQDLDISLYSNQIGIDLFYRKTGDNYKIMRMSLGQDVDTRPIRNANFNGFKASIKGFNLYYITKHRKHSYPAAYNQSTCQKKSAGSPLFGIGYGHYSITMDWQELDNMLSKYVNGYMPQFTQTPLNGVMNYDCYSVYGGYSYNWVFARNWLLGTSMTMALSYNISKGESFTVGNIFNDFKLRCIRSVIEISHAHKVSSVIQRSE